MEKYAIKTTDLKLADQVFQYLKTTGVGPIGLGKDNIGSYQTTDGGWGMADVYPNWIKEDKWIEITDKEFLDKFVNIKKEEMLTAEFLYGKCVYLKNEEESRIVQEKAFELGITWNGRIKEITDYSNKYIFFYRENYPHMAHGYTGDIRGRKVLPIELFKQEIMTKQQELEEAKRKVAELEKAIEEENKINVGDLVVCTDITTNFDDGNGQSVWRIEAKLVVGDVYKVIKVNPNDIKIDGKGYNHSPKAFRKATVEEAEKFYGKEYKLSTGKIITIKKDGIYDWRGTKYSIEDLEYLIPAVKNNFRAYDVTIVDFKYHIGCSDGTDITLKEIQDIIEIAKELQNVA